MTAVSPTCRIPRSSSRSSSRKWREGYKVVIGVKEGSHESWLMSRIRKFYYWLVQGLRRTWSCPQLHGFGLYDREVVEQFRARRSSTRTSAASSATSGTSGPRSTTISRRGRGKTKNNFFSLYDIGDAGHHQPLEGPAAHRHDGRVRPLDLEPAGRPSGYLVAEAHLLEQVPAGLAPGDLASTSSAPSSSSSSGCSASTSARSTRRSTSDRWWWRRNGSTSMDGPCARIPCFPAAEIRRGRVKASDYIADFLAEQGCHATVYELTGGMITHLLDSLHCREDIDIVSMHHEQAAAFAAEAGARMTGFLASPSPPVVLAHEPAYGHRQLLLRFGACCVHHGTGQHVRATRGECVRQPGFQETDIVAMARPITKAAWRVTSAAHLPEGSPRRSRARSGRHGPGAARRPDGRPARRGRARRTRSRRRRSGPDEPHLELVGAVASADRPLMVAGGGARRS